ncbi:MAG: hypothetical protein A2Y15_08940 [Clostridiales bacterium GWF2_36_10]|nr:MAG: hypothetical protein A2Y15_08940 [Clostridiales bacterium GWF2_36_10]HAN20599.1 M48 family peptidase [Clostridiales bacterium]
MLDYKLIRSSRKTLSLEISADKQIIVRAPFRVQKSVIDSFVCKHIVWIEKHLEKRKNQINKELVLTSEQIKELKRKASEYLPSKTAYFANIMDVKPTSVKITSAKKRFGSCSPKNGICYSWRLMNYPVLAIDYVIVHELAHIKHKNHSKALYEYIEKYLPDYKNRLKLLKDRS